MRAWSGEAYGRFRVGARHWLGDPLTLEGPDHFSVEGEGPVERSEAPNTLP